MKALVGLVILAVQSSPETEFLELINRYRAKHRLGSLVITPKLTKAARWMSEDMAAKNYMNHTDSLGRDPFRRMADLGYAYNTDKGENLAAGQETADAAILAWKNSQGHNANMLNPRFKAIGIARVHNPNSTFGWYWTTNFGGYVDGTGDPSRSPQLPETNPEPAPLDRVRQTVRENEPWSSMAIFLTSAHLTNVLLSDVPGRLGRLSRGSLPIAVGMGAMRFFSGRSSLPDVLLSAGSYFAAGLFVTLVAEGLIYPALFAAGPPGYAVAGLYSIAKFVATLYVGSKMEEWARSRTKGQTLPATTGPREGVKQKIDGLLDE